MSRARTPHERLVALRFGLDALREQKTRTDAAIVTMEALIADVEKEIARAAGGPVEDEPVEPTPGGGDGG